MPTSSVASISRWAMTSAASSSTVTFTVGLRCRNMARHSGTKPMLKVPVAPMRTSPESSSPARIRSRQAVVHLAQRLGRIAQEGLAGLGEHHALADAVEQELPDLFFQLPDLVRQRRLRDVHALGRAGEGQALRQRDEVAQVPQFHRVYQGE